MERTMCISAAMGPRVVFSTTGGADAHAPARSPIAITPTVRRLRAILDLLLVDHHGPRSTQTRARCRDPPPGPPDRAPRRARAAPREPPRAAAAGRSAAGAPGSDRLRGRRTTPPRYQPSRLLRKPNGTPTA